MRKSQSDEQLAEVTATAETAECDVVSARASLQRWEYLLVPLEEAKKLKKDSDALPPSRLNGLGSQGWEAVGLSLKVGDLVAWPVVLLKRPVD